MMKKVLRQSRILCEGGGEAAKNEIGREAWWGREEKSGGGVFFKKKKKRDSIRVSLQDRIINNILSDNRNEWRGSRRQTWAEQEPHLKTEERQSLLPERKPSHTIIS